MLLFFGFWRVGVGGGGGGGGGGGAHFLLIYVFSQKLEFI